MPTILGHGTSGARTRSSCAPSTETEDDQPGYLAAAIVRVLPPAP
jgi:hypothetical protein